VDKKIITCLIIDGIKAYKRLIRRAEQHSPTNPSQPAEKELLLLILGDGRLLNLLHKELDNLLPNKKPSHQTLIKQNINNLLELRRSQL
jgi:hypothetical protein